MGNFLGLKIKDRPEYIAKTLTLAFLEEESVLTAAAAMSEKNFGSCVVIDKDKKPVGIVTERDLMRKVVAKGLAPKDVTLKDIMTTELKVARPEDKIVDWLKQMSNERFRRLPVVDEEGKLVNIMTQGDFVSYAWPELYLGRYFRIIFILGGLAIYVIATLILINLA